eukprot:518240_1
MTKNDIVHISPTESDTNTNLINSCRLDKKDILMLLSDNSMNNTIEENTFYVRVWNGTEGKEYTIGQINYIHHYSNKYKMKSVSTNKGFSMSIGKSKSIKEFTIISNGDCTNKEINEWINKMKKDNIELPTHKELNQKAYTLSIIRKAHKLLQRQQKSIKQPPLNKLNIHLCTPSLINHLMKLNNIKYIGCGLRNLNNSCFMNSIIQCLAYTQPFQNYLHQKIHANKCATNRSNNGNKKKNNICFMCELDTLLFNIINRRWDFALSPTKLFNNLPLLSSSLIPGRQEDSHEFWTALIKHLQYSVIKPHKNRNKKLSISIQETSIIYKIWGGYLRSQILCTICNKGSNTYDSIIDLSLEIRGCNNIISALKKFTIQEKLIDDNKYFCQYCNKKQNAIKQLTIFDAPNILILHLKRFEFGTKIDKFISFDTILDLTPFMSQYKKYKQKK